MIQIEHLSVAYQQTLALEDLSLTIQGPTILGILGPNGAGKSTFSKLVCGFEDPNQGEIFFEGQDLLKENIRSHAKKIGYVMQNPNQMISKTMIYDEVALGLQKSGKSEEEIRAKVEETLKIVVCIRSVTGQFRHLVLVRKSV